MVRNHAPLIAFLITALLFTFSQAYAYTEITNCTNITQPGEYRLVNDIINPGFYVSNEYFCIDISSSDVVLDCQNHFIEGSSYMWSYGIHIEANYSNITIVNCVLRGWYYGIGSKYYSEHINIKNITAYYNRHGIFLINSNYVTILNVNVSDNDYGGVYLKTNHSSISNIIAKNDQIGVSTEYSVNLTVSNVIAENCYYGVLIVGENITLLDIVVNSNLYSGVEVDDSNNVTIINVTSTYDSYGVYFSYSNNCTAINITANYEYDGGIYIEYSDGSYFEGITINSCAEGSYSCNGIYTWGSNNNTFYNFYIFNLTGDGISINYNSYGNEFKKGIIEKVSGNGINIDSSGNNTFHNIIIKNSDKCGIYLSSSGYNLFYNNIFMNRNNTCFAGNIYPNYWNTTLKRGKNILGGLLIGGNFWGRPDGKSILDELKYAIIEGIYTHPYDLLGDGTNVDYHPLARVVFVVPPIFKSLVGLGMGIAFIMGAITLLFGIDFSKNPLSSIILVMIGLAVMLLMFTYLWEML